MLIVVSAESEVVGTRFRAHPLFPLALQLLEVLRLKRGGYVHNVQPRVALPSEAHRGFHAFEARHVASYGGVLLEGNGIAVSLLGIVEVAPYE